MGLDRTVLFRLATRERLERAVKRTPGGEVADWRGTGAELVLRENWSQRTLLKESYG